NILVCEDETGERSGPNGIGHGEGGRFAFLQKVSLHPYNKKTLTALRYEPGGVQHHSVYCIAKAVEFQKRRAKVVASVGSQESRHVFQKHEGRDTALVAHFP